MNISSVVTPAPNGKRAVEQSRCCREANVSKFPACALPGDLFLVCGLLVLFVFSNCCIKGFTIYDLPYTGEKSLFRVLDSQVCCLRRAATSGLYLSFRKSVIITGRQQTYRGGNAISFPAPENKLIAREKLSFLPN